MNAQDSRRVLVLVAMTALLIMLATSGAQAPTGGVSPQRAGQKEGQDQAV